MYILTKKNAPEIATLGHKRIRIPKVGLNITTSGGAIGGSVFDGVSFADLVTGTGTIIEAAIVTDGLIASGAFVAQEGNVIYAPIPAIPTPPPEPTVVSNGTTYYVDGDTGNDNNSGTNSSSPLRTFDAGLNKLNRNGGDTLIVYSASGNYSSDLMRVPVINGNSNAWTTIKGADGQTVTITGNDSENLTIGRSGSTSYIYVKNFKIEGRGGTDCIRVINGCHDIFVDDVECDGNNASLAGVRIGNYATNSAGLIASYDLYFKDVYSHNFTMSSDSRCFHVYARSHDIVFIGCHGHNAENNFAGHNALFGTYKDVGPPDNPADVMDNIWCINCLSHDSGEGGFDWANCHTEYYIGCQSYGDSEGIKTWARESWIVNCDLYDHSGPGIAVKPNFSNNKTYIINNTLVNNNTAAQLSGQIRIPAINGGHVLYDANFYIYNNIFQTNKNIFGLDGSNWNFIQCNYNYYFGTSDSTLFYEQYDQPNSWNKVGSQNFSWAKSSVSNLTGDDSDTIIRTGSDGLSHPGFTNPSGNVHTLATGSLAIDAAIAIQGLLTDKTGRIRYPESMDMGCYER